MNDYLFWEQIAGGILLMGILLFFWLAIKTWLESRKKQPDEHQFFPPPF
jgi:hypothetical protein